MGSEIWSLFNEVNNSYKTEVDNFDENTNLSSSFKNDSLKDKDGNLIEICYNCKKSDFLLMDGEMIVCTYCGVENESIIDYNAEWRYYGSDDNKRSSDPNRCGIPMNPIIPDSSLSTVILGKGFEVYRKLNSWNGLSYKQRSLIAILNKIATKANIDNVPQSIIDATMNMYKIISQDYIKRGASRESLIAACFFNALRDQGMIRSTEEVAKLFDIKYEFLIEARPMLLPE
jgi:transcription initiation factor TFIIIB Brf1 subunit/transcription initiation factor TFIIB